MSAIFNLLAKRKKSKIQVLTKENLREIIKNYEKAEIIKIPRGIERIDDRLFYNNKKLKKVILPKSLKTIGESAFSECEKLEEIEIPEGIEVINRDTFSGCNNLKTITLPKSLKTIGKSAFSNCKNLEEIEIPEGVEEIEDDTFYDCYNLSTIILPKSLKKIGYSAFCQCKNLQKIALPHSLKEIKGNAFYGCENLQKIALPHSLEKVDATAFYGCENLKEMEFKQGMPTIDIAYRSYTNESDLKRMSLPHNLKTISDYLFIENLMLEEVVVPEGIEKIGCNAFEKCKNLKKITLPKSLKTIDKSAFSYCRNLEKIEIPKEVEVIGDSTFLGCYNLKTITIPKSLKTIGGSAFFACENLEEIEMPEGIEAIGNSTFSVCKNLKTITLPKSLKIIGSSAFFKCENLEEIEIPEGIEVINSNTFSECTNLKIITLPKSLKTIGSSAFSKCENLEEIEIPEGIEVINSNTFSECKNLKTITLPKSLKIIGSEAFEDCNSFENLEIPEGVEEIEYQAFNQCYNLKKITLSINLKKVNSGVPEVIKSLEIVDGNKFVLSEETKKSEKGCNIFSKFTQLNVGTIFDNKDNILELIEKVNKLPEDIKIPGTIIPDGATLNKLLDKDYKIMRNLINLIPEETREICMPELYKLANAMGVLEKKEVTIKVNGKEVPARDVAYTVLQGAIKQNILEANKIHANFSSMDLGGYNEEFLKFMANKTNLSELMNQEETQLGFTSRVYSWFEERKNMVIDNNGDNFITREDNRYKIMTYEETVNEVDRVKWKKPTVELLKKEFTLNKFTGIITERDREIGEYLSQYHLYEQRHFDKAKEIDNERIKSGVEDHLTKEKVETTIVESIDDYRRRTGALNAKILDEAKDTLKTQKDIADKIFTYEMLAKSDVANFAMGILTDCCASLYGAGGGAQRAMIIDKNIQPLVLRDSKGNIICFGIIYVNREEGYAVINDFELNKKYKSDLVRKEIYTKAMQGVEHFVTQYNKENSDKPINLVTCGVSPNWEALNAYIRSNPRTSVLKAPDFSKFQYNGKGAYSGDWHKEQYIVWKNKAKEGNKR